MNVFMASFLSRHPPVAVQLPRWCFGPFAPARACRAKGLVGGRRHL